MGEFKSLAAALEGHYEMALTDLPDDLRRWVEQAFVLIPWDTLASNNRRRIALEWDAEHDPAKEEERQAAWDSAVQIIDADLEIERLKRQIANLGEMVVTAPSEASAKRAELDVLQRRLASAELARKELLDEDAEPEERSAATVTASDPTTPARISGIQEAASGPSTSEERPIYEPPVTYSPREVPKQFNDWARAERDRKELITVGRAQHAMRGPKGLNNKRAGGKLVHGRGLSRETIEAWIETLPEGWCAVRGESPSRRRQRP